MIYKVVVFFLYHQTEKMQEKNWKPPDLNPGLLYLETCGFPLDYYTPDNLPTYLNIYTLYMSLYAS